MEKLRRAELAMPSFTTETTGQKVDAIQDYLRLLLGELRYSMTSMEADNFTEAGLEEIRNPLRVRLEGAEKELAELKLEADGLRLTVSNGDETSTIKLMAGETELSSQEIKLTGMVSFTSLQTAGQTQINAGNITTGIVKTIDFQTMLSESGNIGGQIRMCYKTDEGVAGGIRLDDQGAGTSNDRSHRLFLYTQTVDGHPFAMKLKSASGVSVEAVENIYMNAASMRFSTAGDINLVCGHLYVNGREL